MSVSNWRTTAAGVVFFVKELSTALYAWLDGVDTTKPDWNMVMAAAIVMYGLFAARDKDE